MGAAQPPKASYIFKHALVQDTAYGSLLRGRRQRIHADIAQALEQRLADEECRACRHRPSFHRGGSRRTGGAYWLAAAELALSQSAPTEAERHASAGLALIPRIAEGRNATRSNWGSWSRAPMRWCR